MLDRTAPVLIDAEDVAAILDLTPGQFDLWVRSGRLEDVCCVGERRLFRAADVRALLLAA